MKKQCLTRLGSCWSQQVGLNGTFVSINKYLISFLIGVYSKVQMIVGRIFQKVPDLLRELEDQVEEEGGSQTARKRMLIQLVLEKVCHSSLFSWCVLILSSHVSSDRGSMSGWKTRPWARGPVKAHQLPRLHWPCAAQVNLPFNTFS